MDTFNNTSDAIIRANVLKQCVVTWGKGTDFIVMRLQNALALSKIVECKIIYASIGEEDITTT